MTSNQPPFIRILRITGLFVWLSLAISPWLVAVEVNDPFLNQGWLLFGLAVLSVTIFALAILFFQPQQQRFPTLLPVVFTWVIFCISTLFSPFFISLRIGLLWSCQLMLFLFLQFSLKKQDIVKLTWVLVFSGFAMAGYALLQACGYDFFNWVDSPYRVVGTFSNPNYLSAYLLTTLLVTVGIFFELLSFTSWQKGFLLVAIAFQVAALLFAKSLGAFLCLIIGLLMYSTTIWEIRPGSWLKRSPFIGGAIVTIILVFSHAVIANSVESFPWNTLKAQHHSNRSIITRLLEWKMGFFLFKTHPWVGTGPGGPSYLMPGIRPTLGTVLGLANYNDDPHSFIISILAETGIFGLFGFLTIFCAALGVHTWKQSRRYFFENGQKGEDSQNPSLEVERTDVPTRVFAVPAIVLLIHGSFNNTLSILPLTNFLLILAAIHQHSCLGESRWRRHFSFSSILYFLFPPLLAVCGWFLMSHHQTVEKCLFVGNNLLKQGDPVQAAETFKMGIHANPQSLHSLLFYSIALDKQSKLKMALENLGQLDALAPNVFGVKYHISRILLEQRLLWEAHRWAFLNLSWNQAPTSNELLGRILILEGRIGEAKRVFENGLAFAPGWSPGWGIEEIKASDKIRLQLAEIEIDMDNISPAQNLLASLTYGVDNSAEGLYLKGLCEYKKQNTNLAIISFELAYTKDKKNPRFANALGYLLANSEKDLPRAKQILEEAFQTYKSQPAPLLSDVLNVAHSLGILYWKLGQTSQARELLYLSFLECPADWPKIKEKRGQDLKNFLKETGTLIPEEENRLNLKSNPLLPASQSSIFPQ